MKIITNIVTLAALAASFTASAEIQLKDNSEILGAWEVYAEAAALNKEKSALNTEWVFKNNGIIDTKSKDTRGRTGTFEIPLKYSIVDGAIKKQSTPGREKYETCKVAEKKGSEMILKCKYLYYFMRKK